MCECAPAAPMLCECEPPVMPCECMPAVAPMLCECEPVVSMPCECMPAVVPTLCECEPFASDAIEWVCVIFNSN